jgi:hypothetical protein
LSDYFVFYITERLYQPQGYKTQAEAYFGNDAAIEIACLAFQAPGCRQM